MEEENEDTSGKQVIARAAAILRALTLHRDGMRLADVARITGLPRTTAHRLVAALQAQDLVTQGPKGIRLGPAFIGLSGAAYTDALVVIRPHLESLGRRTSETVDLCVFQGMHSISVEQYQSNQELRVVSAVGTAFPIYCTAHGKALLSELADAEINKLVGNKLAKRTDRTIVQLDTLLEQIRPCRGTGIGWDIEEHAMGVCGVAIVLDTPTQERYALSIAVPAMRFHDRKEFFESALMQAKAEISNALATLA